MWLRTLWGKTLRDERVPILAWGAGMGLFVAYTFIGYSQLSASGHIAEAEYIKAMRFMGEAVAPQTSEGYVTWHTVGILPVLLGIWAVLAGARVLRREEERGIVELVLTAGASRMHFALQKVGAFALAIMLTAPFIAAGAIIGEAAAQMVVRPVAALLMALNASLAALTFGLLALFIAQFTRRAVVAAGFAFAALVAAYILNGAGRVIAGAEWVQRLTPLYYHDLSKPLIASYGVNVIGMLVLVGICLALAIASIVLFFRRDIGGTAFAFAVRVPTRPVQDQRASALRRAASDMTLRGIFARTIASERMIALEWLVGMAVLTAWLTYLARDFKDAITQIIASAPAYAQLFGSMALGTDAGYISGMILLYTPALMALYALALAMTWPHDLDHGRAELILATPKPHWRVMLEQFGAVTLAALAGPICAAVTLTLTASLAGLSIDSWRIIYAFLGMVPLQLLTATLVFALSGWLRAGVILLIVGIAIGLSYFADLLDPLLKLPSWLVSLSIFHQYGDPFLNTPNWAAWATLTLLAAALLLLGLAAFTRRDLPHAAQ